MTSETEIFNWLDNNEFISSYQVIDFQQDENRFLLKLKIQFIDNSELHTRDSIKKNLRKYSYHWQSEGGVLIVRWDNSPHHPNISTFPHHKHEVNESNIKENKEVSLKEILIWIVNKLKK